MILYVSSGEVGPLKKLRNMITLRLLISMKQLTRRRSAFWPRPSQLNHRKYKMGVQPRKLSVGFLYDDTLDSFDGVAQYVKTLGAWLSSQGHHVCYLVGQTKITNWS